MIKRIFSFFVLTTMAFAFAAAANAQRSSGNYRKNNDIPSFRSQRAFVPGVVAPSNQQAFQIGKDFAVVIDDSKYMGTDNEMFNYTIVDLVYLIDGLEGQPEVQQLQAILKGIVRGTKDLSTVPSEIQAISKAYLARQSAERKWYFNVGSNQMDLLIAGWDNNSTGVAKAVKELQGLSRLAPQGTPQIVLDAIKGLSKYTVKVSLSKDDFTALVNDTKIITTLVFA